MLIEQKNANYRVIIGKLSTAMHPLGTGDLAELRRMAPDGPGCPAFWRLAGECGFIEEANRTDTWMRIVKIMAILTPKGERTSASPVHDSKQRLGAVLCDGGDPAWNAEAQPLLSETRLMRLLAEPQRRAETLERVARMLAANRKSGGGFDCTTIAALLLVPDSKTIPREIARAYYRRLDHAAHEAKQKEDA